MLLSIERDAITDFRRTLTTENGTIPTGAAGQGLLSLWVFLALSAALTWTVWLWPISSHTAFYVAFRGWKVVWPWANIKLLIGNSLPGLFALVWTSREGRGGLRSLLSTVLGWKTRFRWYAFAILLPLGIFAVSWCAVIVAFSQKPIWPPAIVYVNSLVSLPLGVFWEEVAWRAFALRKLQNRYSRLTSALIIGAYWAVWHIPLWILTLKYLTVSLAFVNCLNLISWSVTFAFLYDRSGQSLPVTIVLHSTYLVVQNLVGASLGTQATHVIPIAAMLSLCLAVAIALTCNRPFSEQARI